LPPRPDNPPAARAPLIEVFCSVQGEGRFVGQAMAFVRVATCPIRCLYCDTPHSYTAPPRIAAAGREIRNPVPAAVAAQCVDEVCAASPWGGGARPGAPVPVSLTGGEPLVFPQFAVELGEHLRAQGRRLHLETAALDPAALATVLPVLAHVSADWKLPGTLREGDPRAEHAACVRAALQAGVTIDVKLVLTGAVRVADVADAAARLQALRDELGGDLCVVLQPVTPFGAVAEPLDPVAMGELAAPVVAAGLPYLVLPQVHKTLQIP